MMRFAVQVLFVIGIVCLFVGAGWEWLNPPSSYWSEAQAREYLEAYNELHAAQDRELHGSPGNPDQATADGHRAYLDARERYVNLTADLERARQQRKVTGKYLAIGGLAAIAAAILVRQIIGPSADR